MFNKFKPISRAKKIDACNIFDTLPIFVVNPEMTRTSGFLESLLVIERKNNALHTTIFVNLTCVCLYIKTLRN